MKTSKIALVSALTCLFLSACADVQVLKDSDISSGATRISDAEAKKQFLEAENQNMYVAAWNWRVSDILISDQGVTVKWINSDGEPVNSGLWPFTENPSVWKPGGQDGYVILPSGGGYWPNPESAARFTRIFYSLKYTHQQKHAGVDTAEIEAFQAGIAAQYLAAKPKPVPGEDVRRFTIQATDAVKQGRFADALAFYNKALEVAPWWPEGHYNAALIHGTLEENGAAITEMKKYLLLVPNAPNARAAQDKIYVWEGRMGH